MHDNEKRLKTINFNKIKYIYLLFSFAVNMRLSVQFCILSIIAEQVMVLGQTGDSLAIRDVEQKILQSLSPHCFQHLLGVSVHLTFVTFPLRNCFLDKILK